MFCLGEATEHKTDVSTEHCREAMDEPILKPGFSSAAASEPEHHEIGSRKVHKGMEGQWVLQRHQQQRPLSDLHPSKETLGIMLSITASLCSGAF